MSKPYIVVGGKRHPIVHGIKLGKSAKFLDGYVKITADSIDAADKDHVHSQYITNITSKMITDALGYTPSKNVEVIDNLESTSTDSALSANQGKALKDLVDAKQPKGDYASASHTHDWDSVTGKPTTYPPTSHNHDERYYTETEIDTKMSGKSNIGHTHAWNTITGKPDTFAPSSHKHTSDDIDSLDADKITGKINIENLPAGALERCVHVADDKARFALTTEYVQLGDTVKVESTGLMYYVIDIANLNSEDGYDVYTAGSASTVPWSGVTGKPDTFTPSTHTHDDRYYTESEIDTKLGTKANANHTHTQYLTEINSKMVTDALGYTPPTADTNTVTNVGTSSSNYTNGNILIQGSGATSVSKNGNTITISSTDNNTVYTHPTYTSKTSGLYKVTVDSTGHVSSATAVTKADITGLGIPGSDTDTWRGIQDNLTSDSATDSLSAKQGKVLKGLIDGKQAAGSYASASHKQAYTSSELTDYTSDGNTMGVTPAGVKKAISLFEPKSHTHSKSEITDFPTIPSVGSGTITINQGGTKKGSFTVNQSGNTTIELTDSNTTYNDATTTDHGLMTAAMVTKLNGIAAGATAVSDSTVSGWGYKKTDTNTVTNVGTSSSNYTNGNILIQGTGATTVTKNGNTITISSTDNNTVYTHPTYTSKTSGLYKITVDGTGHVSATSAVTKEDITGLGIPSSMPTSLPASDVYSWAKASTKPTYTASEVGAMPNTNASHTGTLRLASNGTSSDHVKLDETQIPVALDIMSGAINAMDVYEGGEKLTEKYAAKSHTHAQYITGITSNMVTTALGYTPPSTNTTYSASTGLSLSGTAFSVKYGTAAGTACQGNDSRLSNSRPASDVYSWAKASTKPSYTASEVGALSTAGGTLTGGIKLPGSSSKGISLTNSYAYPAQIYVSDKSLRLNSVSSGSFGAAGIEISSCGNGIFPYAVSPSGNGYITWAQNLGSSSRKWGTIYSTSSSLNSDKKEKKDITKLNECELNEKYVDAFENIDFVKFRWKNNKNGGLEVPASSRFHYGIIAQDIEKLLNDLGIDNYDNGIIKSAFFLDNTSDTFITGGYQPRFINEESNITYDYSENVYNYKHGNEYEIYNEIIEKDLTNYDKFGLYLNRQNISYIMIEDNSKLDHDNTQPPITIKNIMLVNSDGEYKTLSLNEGVSYYESDDENKENPKTSGTKNDDGTITITFSKKYSTYMIKVDEFVLSEYTKILLNVDYVGEYKIYLIPTAEKEHVNANVWDRARVDDTMLTYSVDYNELHNMCLYAAQQKIKQQESEISVLKSEIQEIKELLGNA